MAVERRRWAASSFSLKNKIDFRRAELEMLFLSRTRMVQLQLFSPPRRAPGARKDAPFFVAGITPGLVGPEIEGPTETPSHTARVPGLGGPAVSAVPAPPKLDIPRFLGP